VGLLAFLWTLLEVFHGPTGASLLRAKAASLTGTGLIFGAWLMGGMYYAIHYGKIVKPVITEGPWPWAHGVFMEAKEHIFLFIPFVAVMFLVLVWQHGDQLSERKDFRFATFATGGLVVLLGALMTAFGYFVSNGFRAAVQP
jgi:hypothetical protein